jgi:hypothetical protein
MLKRDKSPRVRRLCNALLALLVCLQIPNAVSEASQAESQGPIKDGIGVGEILIGTSSASDVEARYGKKYELFDENKYSYRMEFADLGLAFYYCQKDAKKRIFLVEVHRGVTNNGLIIGKSTLKEVLALYGERTGGHDDIVEFKGVQFYFESLPQGEDKSVLLNRKLVEVDIVAPDKSSNFCD